MEIDHLKVNSIFLEVFSKVSETMLDSKLEYGPPEVEMMSIMPSEVNSVVNISGELKGSPFKGVFTISWPESSYIKLASAMLMEDYTEINDENFDAGCELVNIIYGNCKPDLVENDYKVDMSIPMLARAVNFELLSLQSAPSMMTEINSSMGTFHVTPSLTKLEDEMEDSFSS